jgi:hypothetical protein
MEHLIYSRKENNIFKDVINNLDVHMGRICNGCRKELYLNVDNIYHDNYTDTDLCDKCINNNNIHKQHIKIIDRINMSISDKPLKWPCKKCKCMLGGGHKWNLYYRFIDICDTCNKCYDISDIIKKEMKYLGKDDSYLVNEYEYIININPVSTFSIPDGVVLTDKRNDKFIELIPDIIDTDIDDSLLKWTLITDIISVEEYDGIIYNYTAMVGLIIKCEYPYTVASMCIDDHGRKGTKYMKTCYLNILLY